MPEPKYEKVLLTQATRLILPWEGIKPHTFPKTEAGVGLLAKTLLDLAGTDNWEIASQFCDLIGSSFPYCPSPLEMRRVFCQRWKPADGIEDTKADLSDFASMPGRKKGGEE